MPKRNIPAQSTIRPKQWSTPDEIDLAINKIQRRISDFEALNVRDVVLNDSGEDDVVISNVRETIRDVFGQDSPEFNEHKDIALFSFVSSLISENMDRIANVESEKRRIIVILKGLIGRLGEKRDELVSTGTPKPQAVLDYLNLHPRIAGVAEDLFRDGHPWDAFFAASKALINYIKERSRQDQLDGAPLVRTVFSKNKPILSFNDLSTPIEMDEQEGMMHLFEGVVLGIRNPGGHSFPEGPVQRAVEYLSLISLLAYRVQEAKFTKP